MEAHRMDRENATITSRYGDSYYAKNTTPAHERAETLLGGHWTSTYFLYAERRYEWAWTSS